MNFIELTSYVGDPQGYADGPHFSTDLWPLLRTNGKEIQNVFLFANHSSRRLGWPGYYEVVTESMFRIKSMEELAGYELEKMEHLSFYGGHLNVLYQVSSESSLLRELCNLFPVANLSSDDLDQLGLDPEYLTELGAFTAAFPKELLHFSFAHDADPLYIFGELEELRALLRTRREPLRISVQS